MAFSSSLSSQGGLVLVVGSSSAFLTVVAQLCLEVKVNCEILVRSGLGVSAAEACPSVGGASETSSPVTV